MEIKKKRDLGRGIGDYAGSNDTVHRSRGIFALVQTLLGIHDNESHSNQWGRNITDNASVVMENSNTAEYIRELHDSSDVDSNTSRRTDYKRLQQDAGIVREEAKRMLGVFVKLVSGSMIRDYVINRFLKSKDDIQIKSKVTRELVIESRID
jgi:hypothetical protein